MPAKLASVHTPERPALPEHPARLSHGCVCVCEVAVNCLIPTSALSWPPPPYRIASHRGTRQSGPDADGWRGAPNQGGRRGGSHGTADLMLCSQRRGWVLGWPQ